MILSDKAQVFLAKSPTHIGTVSGHAYYEHPTLGDESPLVEITPEGKLRLSEWYDLPRPCDLD